MELMPMDSKNTLSEYIKLILEKKIREVDLSDDRRSFWGSDEHITDLETRLKSAIYWRDKQRKGSEKRSYYRGVVNDIKSQLASAKNQTKKDK